MLCNLIAYNAAGEVVATLEHMVARDEDGKVIGLIDFAAHEDAGGKMRDIWEVSSAAGSGTWPEWIGSQAHDYTVEVDPATKKIKSLTHKTSGRKRVRADIEARIEERIKEAKEAAGDKPYRADISDIVGGPGGKHLRLDEHGAPVKTVKAKRTALPVVVAEGPGFDAVHPPVDKGWERTVNLDE